MQDINQHKTRIREYLQIKGVRIEKTDAERISCPIPGHNDNKPSAIVYDENIYCPVCCVSIDIYELAGYLDSLHSFPEKKKAVFDALGVSDNKIEPRKPKPKKNEPANVIPLSYDRAKQVFTRKRFLEMSEFRGNGDPKKGYGDEITGAWPYKNEAGEVELIDVRFEGGPRKKNVVSFYWDGNHVKSKNAPVKVAGRHLLAQHPDNKVLIVEGCKAWDEAKKLIDFGFVPVTWNGGTGKILKADWSCVYSRDVYFLPDDDKPGIKAAMMFRKENGDLVNDWKIITPYEPARELKPSGADIVEILQLISPEELAQYINNCPEFVEPVEDKKKSESSPPKSSKPPMGSADDGLPFETLGIADDSQAYFINRNGRLYSTKLDSINKNKLLSIAPLSFWLGYVGTSKLTADDWLFIQDDMIELAGKKCFDTDNIRGRGAWKGKDGNICYFDGEKTIGNASREFVFLRKTKINIGIGKDPLGQESVDKMKETCFNLSFESKSDAMRLLSWSILAPFSGALEWRPQAFITGPSSSGKSSIENYIVKKMSLPFRINGGDTTAAGYTQNRNSDSGGVVIEESETDTEKKRQYRQDMLSIMRQSTSDDTPKSYKGTSDQTGRSYMTRDMFCFIAISPEIESVADDNRLVRINTQKPTGCKKWGELRADLEKNITDENCARIRSMTWDLLPAIKKLSDVFSIAIQEYTGKDHRFGISEGTLMAAYFAVWKGLPNPTEDEIKAFIEQNYDLKKPEDERDETEEMIDKILEYKVRVYIDKPREFNVLECLNVVYSGKIASGADTAYDGDISITKDDRLEFKRAINNIGITIDPDGNLAIANNHNEIKRITNKGYGYAKLLKRHKDLVESSKNVFFIDKKGRRCTTIANIVQGDELPF